VPDTVLGGEGTFRSLLEAAPDAMVIVDEGGTIRIVNSQTERLFGWDRAELLGKPVEVLIPDRFRDSHSAHRQAYAHAPRTRNMGTGLELYGRRKDGSEFPVEVSLSPLVTPTGRLVTAAVRDITDRKRAEAELAARAAELARSNGELEQFAYVASHDLQEPLRMIASYTGLLKRRYAGKLDADADEFIGYATDGVARMQALIQDLLAYSRVNRRDEPFLATPLDSVLTEVLANLRRAIQDAGATVVVGELPTVSGDRFQLVQLFQNLIANAVKFHAEAPPRVEVSAERGTDGWTIRVADNGIGIDPQFFERIFVIFQRLHTRDRYPGTGIGLAICRRIAERHGGRIWVESSGRGSTFSVFFPDPRPRG
jgi:PAS domain S-box-containing protein